LSRLRGHQRGILGLQLGMERPGNNVSQLDRVAGVDRGETDGRLFWHAAPVEFPPAGAGMVVHEDVGDQQLLGTVIVDMGTHYCVTADAAVLVHLRLCALAVEPNLDPLIIGIPGVRHEEQEQTNVAATVIEFGTIIICLTRVGSEAQCHLEACDLAGGLVPERCRALVHHAVNL